MRFIYISFLCASLLGLTTSCMEQKQFNLKEGIISNTNYFRAEDHYKAILALKELSYEARKEGAVYKKTLKNYIFEKPRGYGKITVQGILYELCYPANSVTADVYTVKPYEVHHAHELFTPWGHIKLLPLNLSEITENFLPSFKCTLISEEQEIGFITKTYLVNEVRGIHLPSDTKGTIGYCLNKEEFERRHKILWPAFEKKYKTSSEKKLVNVVF